MYLNTYKKGNRTIKILVDPFPVSPRDQLDSPSLISIKTRRYNSLDELAGVNRDDFIILPVYGYLHGGIKLSLTPFNCPWDSGQAGEIGYPKKGLSKEEITSIKKQLEEEIEDLSSFLNGECYIADIYEGEKLVDSVPYYGDTGEENLFKYHLESKKEGWACS